MPSRQFATHMFGFLFTVTIYFKQACRPRVPVSFAHFFLILNSFLQLRLTQQMLAKFVERLDWMVTRAHSLGITELEEIIQKFTQTPGAYQIVLFIDEVSMSMLID